MFLEKEGRLYNVELMINKNGIWTARKSRKKSFKSLHEFENWCQKWDRRGFIVDIVELDASRIYDYTPLVRID